MISFIILNEYSTIGPVKMLRQGRNKLLNTGYLFVLNTLFQQTSNLSFSSGYGNSEWVTYFCISDEYSLQPFDKKVSRYGFKFKRFSCVKDDWRNRGSKAQKNLTRWLFIWRVIDHFRLHKAPKKSAKIFNKTSLQSKRLL